MDTLVTLGFVAATALAVFLHLRRTSRSARAAAPSAIPCPRCGAPAPGGAALCRACGVPLQAYEVVSARAAAPAGEAGSGGGVRPHAVVRADLCVGCGTCAAACPEPGAITLKGKTAIVDRGACVGHGRCVEACPVGGIFLSMGEAVQRVEVPDLDPNFQTNVTGLYIAGELGGRGLIKNAINEGRIAVEHAAASIAEEGTAGVGFVDLAIVGSGPAGLAAALEAKRLGLTYTVLERGSISDTIRKYPRRKLLLAEPVRVPLYGDLWIADASKESLLKVWEGIIASQGLRVVTGCEVTSVERVSGGFSLATTRRTILARRVVLAMGRRGKPRRLEVPGEDLGKVLYDVVEMEAFRDRRVLVVGGGDSAVESALGLANQAGTKVTLCHRGDAVSRIAPRNRAKLDAAVSSRTLELLLKARVLEIREGEAVVEAQTGVRPLPNDDVIVRIGGEPPKAFLLRSGIRLVEKDIPVAGATA